MHYLFSNGEITLIDAAPEAKVTPLGAYLSFKNIHRQTYTWYKRVEYDLSNTRRTSKQQMWEPVYEHTVPEEFRTYMLLID